jgi:16S rRNA processing protein RimM
MVHQPRSEWVCVAKVATAHGVRGALKLRCFTEVDADAATYGPFHDREGQRLFSVQVIGQTAGGLIVRAKGISDRDQALALRGTELFVPRARLPEPDEGEFYYTDLEGLEVRRSDGSRLGVVRAVDNYGAGDVLEIRTEGGRPVTLPFDRETVPTVDLAAGHLVVEPPAELLPGAGS